MYPGSHVVGPDVPGNGRSMVFSPFTLISLFIVVEHPAAVPRDLHVFGRDGQHLIHSSPADRHFVQLRLRTVRKLPVLDCILPKGPEKDVLVIG